MSLFFKKKKEQSALYTSLDIALQEALENKRDYFYLGLLEGDEHRARAWTIRHRILMEASHKNGNTTVYKFYNIRSKNNE